MRRSAELAWAAGIVEGEGSIHVRDRDTHRSIVLTVVMSDLDVLQRLESVLRVGTIVGPYQQRPGVKPLWHWNVTCARHVAAVVMTLYPLLHGRRRKQVRKVLDAWQRMPGRKNRVYC